VLASGLVVALALLSACARLGIGRRLLIAATRTAVQLLLIGMVLEFIFQTVHWAWISGIFSVMLIIAAREVMVRQTRRFHGWWAIGIGGISMTLSSFTLTLFALQAVVQPIPWYTPQYAIPLLGMMLGNTMNGISISLDRLTGMCWQMRETIENRLMLGETWSEAVSDIRKESIRSGMIPIINAMSVAGLVSLPGMMTGQILAGNPPHEAVKYQVLIMFLIAGGTGFGTFMAVWLGSRRLFDQRHRLRLDRLSPPR